MMDTLRTRAFALALPVLLLCLPGAAVAKQAKPGRGITGAEAAAILQDAGYRARLDTDGGGDPMIESRMSGVTVYLYFYDCDAKRRCGSLQFLVGLDLEEGWSSERLNAFNREYRYVRSYLDDERDPFLAMDFELLHADHDAQLRSQLDLWEDLLGAFLKATGYDGSGPQPAAAPAASDA